MKLGDIIRGIVSGPDLAAQARREADAVSDRLAEMRAERPDQAAPASGPASPQAVKEHDLDEWSLRTELLVEFGADVDARHRWRAQGLDGFAGADARIIRAGTAARPQPHLRLRPLTQPPGPFDLRGLLCITPFVEITGARPTLVAFEERIGRRYYEFLAAARFRYAAACDVQVHGLPLEATCAEVYSIDAQTKAEADELDASTSPEPPDVAAFYAECRGLKVPGSGRQIWLFPPEPTD